MTNPLHRLPSQPGHPTEVPASQILNLANMSSEGDGLVRGVVGDDIVRLAEKGGDEGNGADTMSCSWWLDIPGLGGRWEAAAAAAAPRPSLSSCPDAPLSNSSHSLCARDYDWGLDVHQH